jgi:hypothetical protein
MLYTYYFLGFELYRVLLRSHFLSMINSLKDRTHLNNIWKIQCLPQNIPHHCYKC